MKMKKLLLLPALLLTLSVGNVACSYHKTTTTPTNTPIPNRSRNPNRSPDPTLTKNTSKLRIPLTVLWSSRDSRSTIPILKAFAMWNLYAEWLGETDLMGLTPEPVLLWQDLPGLITNVGLITWTTSRRGFHRRIDGRQGGQCSNRHPHRRCNPLELACLGDTLRSGCGIGRLRQNLHTWDNNGDGVKDYTFMDRNLGATYRQGDHRKYCR